MGLGSGRLFSGSSSSSSGGSSIKQIIRGTVTVDAFNGPSPGTATIAAVDRAKTELRMLGYTGQHVSSPPRITLLTSTTVEARHSGNTTGVVSTVSFELTEFF